MGDREGGTRNPDPKGVNNNDGLVPVKIIIIINERELANLSIFYKVSYLDLLVLTHLRDRVAVLGGIVYREYEDLVLNTQRVESVDESSDAVY